MLREFRIKQNDINDYSVEVRQFETVFFWKSWSPWETVGIKHYYEYHTKHSRYKFETENDAREYIANLVAEDKAKAERRERLKNYPRIIDY